MRAQGRFMRLQLRDKARIGAHARARGDDKAARINVRELSLRHEVRHHRRRCSRDTRATMHIAPAARTIARVREEARDRVKVRAEVRGLAIVAQHDLFGDGARGEA